MQRCFTAPAVPGVARGAGFRSAAAGADGSIAAAAVLVCRPGHTRVRAHKLQGCQELLHALR